MDTAQTTADASRPKLLVVDDQPINVKVLYQTFAADHQVFMATGGEQALLTCRTQLPDLVLLDVQMPGIDGHEVCRRLKADPLTRDIPVIFITAQGDASHEALGLELGAVDFIAKPINTAVVRARVRTHLAFARSRSVLGATLEATADGILVTDLAGGISAMNQNFVRMWRLPRALAEHGHPADHAQVFAFMRGQLLDAGRASLLGSADAGAETTDTLELTGDRHFERHSMPLRINASLAGHVCSFRDVTERRRAERKLQQWNETLEARILERTRELEAALQVADVASRAKSDFLSNISHEIRTPMNGVIGMVHLALNADPEPRQRGYLEKIQSSGKHLLGIINTILDFAKGDAGKLALEEEDFELATVFESVSNQLVDAAHEKGLGLRFRTAPGVRCALRGDALRIGQLLLNYVGNAIKFTARGDIVVQATMPHDAAGRCLLRIEVRDNGIGMTDAQVAQAFQSFQQADASTTRRFGGTGLGLAICKQLAALMGGEVGVTSQAGVGSIFWFTAWLRPAGAAPAATPTSRAAAPTAAPSARLAGVRILVVDDNDLNLAVAEGLLEAVGASVHTAGNGQEALARLEADGFDGVLMDVQMPVMDGLQATRLIRANPRLAGLPVIAMTANAGAADQQRCLAAGMDSVIVKPADPALLYAALARWLTPRPAATSDADALQGHEAAATAR